jgi:hypothetical protein
MPVPAIYRCGNTTASSVPGDPARLLLEVVGRIATLFSKLVQVPLR